MKKFFIPLFCVIFFVGALAYVVKKPSDLLYKESKPLKLCLMTDPLDLDTRKFSDNITSQFALFIYEGMTRFTPDGLKLALAESVKISKDKKTYLFTLRDAQFSDGTPITAQDFERSWKRILDPSFAAYNPDYLFCIKNAKRAYKQECSTEEVGIVALDEKKLQVVLEYPSDYFLELLANKTFYPMPKSFDKKSVTQSNRVETYLSSGPFMIKKWLPHNKIILKKNPNYWDADAVKLQKIELHIISDEMTQLSMFETHGLDWAGSPLSMLPLDSIQRLQQTRNVHAYPTASLYFYTFNTQRFPLNNVNLRKALTLAINRKELIEHVTQGQESPAFALLPTKMHGIHRSYYEDGDQEKAKEYLDIALKELNLTKENFPVLKLSYPNIQARHVLAQAIQQQWNQALGIQVQLESKEWQVFLSEINKRDYQIGAIGRGTHHLDPFYYLSLFKEKNQSSNRSGWEDPKYIKLLMQAEKEEDPSVREKMLSDAESIFMSHMPVAPIFYPTNFYIKNPKLQDVFLSDLGSIDFKWAYFEN